MADRYFVAAAIRGDRATLTGSEAHHLAHVMRAKPGDTTTLFDGSGSEFSARVESIHRTTIELTVLTRTPLDRELPFILTLGVALPKGDRQRWLVEKAVELGVTRLVPLRTERGIADPASAATRLQRTVIEASKQCGRNRLMEIAAPSPWAEYAADPGDALRLLAHPAGRSASEVIDPLHRTMTSGSQVRLAVGPEGGFTDAEVELAQEHGWQVVSLGPQTLRVETAALALTALVTQRV